jgi:hypothetical protein
VGLSPQRRWLGDIRVRGLPSHAAAAPSARSMGSHLGSNLGGGAASRVTSFSSRGGVSRAATSLHLPPSLATRSGTSAAMGSAALGRQASSRLAARDSHTNNPHGPVPPSVVDRAVTTLLARLRDAESDIRTAAAWAVGELRASGNAVFEALSSSMRDRNAAVRAEVARALCAIGDTSTVSAVTQGLLLRTAPAASATASTPARGPVGRARGGQRRDVADDDNDDDDDDGGENAAHEPYTGARTTGHNHSVRFASSSDASDASDSSSSSMATAPFATPVASGYYSSSPTPGTSAVRPQPQPQMKPQMKPQQAADVSETLALLALLNPTDAAQRGTALLRMSDAASDATAPLAVRVTAVDAIGALLRGLSWDDIAQRSGVDAQFPPSVHFPRVEPRGGGGSSHARGSGVVAAAGRAATGVTAAMAQSMADLPPLASAADRSRGGGLRHAGSLAPHPLPSSSAASGGAHHQHQMMSSRGGGGTTGGGDGLPLHTRSVAHQVLYVPAVIVSVLTRIILAGCAVPWGSVNGSDDGRDGPVGNGGKRADSSSSSSSTSSFSSDARVISDDEDCLAHCAVRAAAELSYPGGTLADALFDAVRFSHNAETVQIATGALLAWAPLNRGVTHIVANALATRLGDMVRTPFPRKPAGTSGSGAAGHRPHGAAPLSRDGPDAIPASVSSSSTSSSSISSSSSSSSSPATRLAGINVARVARHAELACTVLALLEDLADELDARTVDVCTRLAACSALDGTEVPAYAAGLCGALPQFASTTAPVLVAILAGRSWDRDDDDGADSDVEARAAGRDDQGVGGARGDGVDGIDGVNDNDGGDDARVDDARGGRGNSGAGDDGGDDFRDGGDDFRDGGADDEFGDGDSDDGSYGSEASWSDSSVSSASAEARARTGHRTRAPATRHAVIEALGEIVDAVPNVLEGCIPPPRRRAYLARRRRGGSGDDHPWAGDAHGGGRDGRGGGGGGREKGADVASRTSSRSPMALPPSRSSANLGLPKVAHLLGVPPKRESSFGRDTSSEGSRASPTASSASLLSSRDDDGHDGGGDDDGDHDGGTASRSGSGRRALVPFDLLEHFVEVLTDGRSAPRRREAAIALGMLRPSRETGAAAALAHALEHDPVPGVRAAAAAALGAHFVATGRDAAWDDDLISSVARCVSFAHCPQVRLAAAAAARRLCRGAAPDVSLSGGGCFFFFF